MFLFVILIIATPQAWADTDGKTSNGVRFHGGDEVILQGFHWNIVRTAEEDWYKIVKDKAEEIKNDGFTGIWLPVPWRDQSFWNPSRTENIEFGGEGYFWTDFNKNSRYGDDLELKEAAAELKGKGVKVIYDIVPNHHNRGHLGDELDLPSNQGYYRTDCGNCDDGDPFMSGDSDFNTANPRIYNLFKDEFSNLKENYSASGFRFDFVRGYAPERIDAWMNQTLDEGFCVGELWKSPQDYPNNDWRHHATWQDIIKNFSDTSNCSVFDFALKDRMQNGSISDWKYGLNGNPDAKWREVAVTFVDNHDTGYSPGPLGGQHHWPLADQQRKMAYAYILSSPGTPVVYWPHMYDWGLKDFLKNLIKIRQDLGIKAYSDIKFDNRYSGLVGRTMGSKGELLFALDSNLSDPRQVVSGPWRELMNEDNGTIRLWEKTLKPEVDVKFSCENGLTQLGQSVYVVGNNTNLGNWDVTQAIKLNPDTYPTWNNTIKLIAGETAEWKCIIRSESNPSQVIKWEQGSNNFVTAALDEVTVGHF
ncbi:glucan 1,4-alpha-maltotetraohydrolase domain-containing protein [Crocosphaera sp.]|uniref:glucan 1,4-alpha-maltotetraohydrolase domain-containing protein n=1 Tax=Crocosphaera sp. TaxID=2729996 RepID=UPI00261A6D75|nr:glucan 1,4-alpha-maltotetraohydrolase domain-containing protein [Crocosphaera sp.]MDJ0583137.1 DUF1921 domain-containing protein [Crocosphaera sp.]